MPIGSRRKKKLKINPIPIILNLAFFIFSFYIRIKVLVALDGVNVFWKDLSFGKKKVSACKCLSNYQSFLQPNHHRRKCF